MMMMMMMMFVTWVLSLKERCRINCEDPQLNDRQFSPDTSHLPQGLLVMIVMRRRRIMRMMIMVIINIA
jgi:hypothetical protein